jgi:transposase-like protein
VIVTDKLRSYAAANHELGLTVAHRQHKGPNNRAENSHQPTRVRETVTRRFKSARQLQQFASVLMDRFRICSWRAVTTETRSTGVPAEGGGLSANCY